MFNKIKKGISMKKIFTFIFCALWAISSWGTEVVIVSGGSSSDTKIPLSASAYSICQFIISSEQLTAVPSSEHNISSISFYYALNKTTQTRGIDVYLSNTTYSSVSMFSKTYAIESSDKVFAGNVILPNANSWYSIPFTNNFSWDGSSNILVTIVDNTGTSNTMSHYVKDYSSNVCCYKTSTSSSIDPTSAQSSATRSTYLPELKFNFCSDAPTYDAPTNVSVTAKSSSSATIGWTKKDEAKIKLQYSVKDAGSSWTTVENLTGASYTISGLSSETTYDYKVFAVYTEGTSDAVTGSFTTDAVSDHEHNGVSFQEWKETESLPTTAGSYYLKDNVTVSSWTVPTGDTKICLNGKTITYTHATSPITIGDSKSLSIYDNEGNGKVTATINWGATIKVNAGGTLSLYSGTIENKGTSSDAFAINVNSGTFNIEGDVKMSTGSSAANIYLQNSKVITLTGAITNTTKLSVYKAANANITSGWKTQMGSADPANYFTSANSAAPAVILVGDEAQLGVPSFEFSETGEYTSYPSGKTDVNLVRTFIGGILNTISLPFALTDEQMKEAFGEDYELYQLSSSALSNNILDVYFDKVTTLALGYPYLLKVSQDIVNPSFSSVTFGNASHRTSTTAIDMVSVVEAQNVTGSDYNLFLNAAGELNWSTQDALFKGMRAYFQVKQGYRDAVAERRLVIRNTPTDLKGIVNKQKVEKIIENGHIIILKNGKKHTIQGQIIK